jgi:hypothetical protein
VMTPADEPADERILVSYFSQFIVFVVLCSRIDFTDIDVLVCHPENHIVDMNVGMIKESIQTDLRILLRSSF